MPSMISPSTLGGKLDAQKISFRNVPRSMPPSMESTFAPVQSKLISHQLGTGFVSVMIMVTNLSLYYAFITAVERLTAGVSGLAGEPTHETEKTSR